MSDIVNGWRPILHPRDQHGRFRNKWKLNATAARLIDAIIGKFDPKMFMSDHDARDYLRQIGGHDYGKHVHPDVTHYLDGGWQQLNADMRKGHGELPQGMADAFKPSEADLVLSRAVSPAAFGLPPNSDPAAVKEWTGRLVADAAPSATSIGNPLQTGPGTINMAILAPKGTDMIVPGNGSPDAILRPDQPIRITRVTGNAQYGIYVWAVLQPHNEKTRTRALGRKLTKAEIGPTDGSDAPEGVKPVETPSAGPEAAPPTIEERLKALEAKMAARANAPAEPAVAPEAKKAVKRAPRKPREPQIADNPPPGEAPSQLDESTPEAAAAVLAVRGARLDSKPNERDVVAFRKKMDEMQLPAVREAAKSLDVPIKGLRKKQDIVDALVRNAYGKRVPIPAREPKPVKKAIKAAETAVPASAPAESVPGSATVNASDMLDKLKAATPENYDSLRKELEGLSHEDLIQVAHQSRVSPGLTSWATMRRDQVENVMMNSVVPPHVVNAVAKRHRLAREAKAAATASTEKPHVFNTMAVGKTNANRVQVGEKILVREDPTHGWGPTSTKTGATEITVTGKERSGPNHVITGRTADGKEITLRPAVSHQTFFLAKEKPGSAAKKATPPVKAAESAKPLTGAEARAARTAKMRARADAYAAKVRANPALIDQGLQGQERAHARRDAIAMVQATVTQMQKDGASNTEIADAVDKLGAKHADLVHPEEANFIESKIGDIADSFRDNKPAIGKRKIALAIKEETPRPTTSAMAGQAKAAEKAATPEPAKPELSPAEQKAADLTARMDRLRKASEARAEAARQAPAKVEAAKPEPVKPEPAKAAARTTPGANLEAGTAFKEAYKTEHAAGNLTSPHGGRQNVEYNKAYLLATRGRFDEAAKDLRADVEHNRGLVADLRNSGSADLAKVEHNLASQEKLLAFIEKHNTVGAPSKKPVKYSSLKHMANGTTKPPPANEYIDPATYFDTAVHDPTGRQARIERAHGIAKIASQLLEHEHNHDDGPAFKQVLATQLQHWDNAPSTRESVARWNALIDFRKENITSKQELRAAVDKLAKEHNLSQVGKPGDVVPFDPRMHDRPPGVQNGDKVEVLRPGFALPKDPNEAHHHALIKAQVIQPESGTPEVHAPAPAATKNLAQDALSKAGVDIPAGKDGEILRDAVDKATTPELAKEQTARLRKHADVTRQLGGMRLSNNPKGSFHHNKGQQDVKNADLYDRAADALDKVGAPETKPATKAASKAAAGAPDLTDKLDAKGMALHGGHRGATAEVLKRQGFDGPPTLADSAGVDSVVKAGGTELWRGMSREHAEQFRSGPLHISTPGNSPQGHGIYAGDSAEVAGRYAEPDGGLVRMVLRPDAKIITEPQLRAIRAKRNDGWTPAQQSMYSDDGTLAAALGYDAIAPSGIGNYVVLNRTALTVEKARPLTAVKDVAAAERKIEAAAPAGKLREGVVSAEKIMADKTPDELRAAAEKVGIHVPDELRTSKEISDHVIKEMTRKAEAANRKANRSPVGKLLADPKMSDRRVLDAADELSPAAHAKLSEEDRASLKDRLGRIANNASNPAEVRDRARKAMDHLAGKQENAQPVKAVRAAKAVTPSVAAPTEHTREELVRMSVPQLVGLTRDLGLDPGARPLRAPLMSAILTEQRRRRLGVPGATKEQFIQEEAKKTAELLKHAATGDEGRGLLANKSRDQLVAIAKAAGIVHSANATKAAIIKEVVFHGVQKRLNSQSIARVATPAHAPNLPNVKPEHHAVTAPRTNMLGELTHQIKEASSDQARHELLANKTSATLHALGKEHGLDFNNDAGKLHMASSIIEKITGRKPEIRAPHNVELQPRHDASVHGDSAIGQLWDKIKSNDQNGESNALLNRLNEIGRDLSKPSNHDDVSAPQAAIDDLKKLRPEDFGSGPLERNRKLIDDAIARMDAPSVTVPDTSELGTTVPHFVHNYLEELAKIPAARKANIPGFRRGPSVFDEKVALIKKLDAGDSKDPHEMRRTLSSLAQRDLHESVEGSYQIWALNHKYFGSGGPGYKANRDWMKAVDEKVKREADAAVNKVAEAPKGKGAPRPYLDEFNRLDLKKLSTELGGDLQRFMDPTRNLTPLAHAPLDKQFPFGYRMQNIVDDAASGNVSHAKTIKELKEAIPITENMIKNAESDMERFKGNEPMAGWLNRQRATIEQGPAMLDLLHQMVTHLEAQKLPSRKTRPTLPPTVSGQLAPVDEARFSQRPIREVLHHGGQAIPESFNHEPRNIPGIRNAHSQIAAKAALPDNPRRPGLNTAENEALDVWTAGAPMRALQQSLRTGKVVHGKINPEDAKHIGEVDLDALQKNLDSAIEKGSLQHDSVLWRGVLVKNADAKRFVPGAVFSEPGYTATAADRKAASDIISLWERDRKFQGQKPAYFKILAPKGTHGALGHMRLSEVLLGRGQRFQVVRVEPGEHGQAPTYVVQALLPDHPQGKNLLDSFDYSSSRDKIVNFGYGNRGKQDLSLGDILKKQGFDAKPKVVDAAELDRAVKEDGAVELHRAVAGHEDKSAAELAEQFRSGALHPGTGAYGAGTYTTPESGVTANYGEEAGQLRMALPPSAKTIKYPDLQKLHEREMADTEKSLQEISTQLANLSLSATADRERLMHEEQNLKARRAINHDLGRYAALLGYDAVIAPQGHRKGPKEGGAAEYIILNRAALLVQKAHDKSQG